MTSQHQTVRIALVGASGTGKTSLLHRFTDQQFQEACEPTLAVNFRLAHATEAASDRFGCRCLHLQIWDTSGHPRFAHLVRDRIRASADVILYVYDATRWGTLEHLGQIMTQFKQSAAEEQQPLGFLIGSMVDKPGNQEVESRRAGDLAAAWDLLGHRRVSAKTGQGVSATFSEAAAAALAHRRSPTIVEVVDNCDSVGGGFCRSIVNCVKCSRR